MSAEIVFNFTLNKCPLKRTSPKVDGKYYILTRV